MKLYEIECSGDDGLIEIDNINSLDQIKIDLYNYHGQLLNIHFKQADTSVLNIDNLEIITANFAQLQFKPTSQKLKIKNLTMECPGVSYKGSSAEVENLNIISSNYKIELNGQIARNVKIQKIKDEDEEVIRKLLPGVNIIPGSGEFVLDPEKSFLEGAARTLDELKASLPGVKWVSPVVSWFATSLDIKTCQILPGKQTDFSHDKISSWRVGNFNHEAAYPISRDEDKQTNFGGSINDESVLRFLDMTRAHGLKAVFYPLIMVDMPKKPWRGHITGNADDIEPFFEKYYRPFIMHYAKLVQGKVDAFLIGSELVKLTSIYKMDPTTKDKIFPFVEKLISLAKDVKNILGANVQVSYAADWSEYHSSNGGLRPLDKLWADESIDFVGIDAYFPLTDSSKSQISMQAIKDGWYKGEGIEFYRDGDQKKSFNESEKWNHWKDLAYWWYSEHWPWDNDKGQSAKSPWEPKSKPIWFTEFGFPSIDKSSNKPNVFYDPKSIDGGVPTHSNGKIDFAIQKKALRATLEYWHNSEFVKNMIAWCWDARSIGWQNSTYFADARLWQPGHWLDGKIGSDDDALVISGKFSCEYFSASAKWINLDLTESVISQNILLNTENDVTIFGKSVMVNTTVIKVGGNVNLAIKEIFGLNLIVQSNGLMIRDTKFNLNDLISFNIYGDILMAARITESSKEYSQGTKDHVMELTQVINRPEFITDQLNIFALGKCNIEAAIIQAKRLEIFVDDIDLQNKITQYVRIEEFKGGKSNPFRVARSSRTDETIETANFVMIDTEFLDIRVKNTFKATASVINTNNLNMQAENYQFSGVNLVHSHVHDSRKSMLHKSSSVKTASGNVNIAGVLINVGGQGYVFAGNELWLSASAIVGDSLDVNAKKVRLDALVGGSFNAIKIDRKGYKTVIRNGDGEYSINATLAKSREVYTQSREKVFMSGLMGRSELKLNATDIELSGGVFTGKYCKIMAERWHNNAVALHNRISQMHTEIAISVGVGIRENISGTSRGLSNSTQAVSEIGGDNNFATINAIASIYGNITDIASLLSGNILSGGIKATASASYSESTMEVTTFRPNLVEAETLEVQVGGSITGSLEIQAQNQQINAQSMDLNTPKDIVKTSSVAVSASIDSSGGYSVSGFKEENGRSFGMGYSGSFGGVQGQAFGGKMALSYSDGKGNNLNVQYTNVDWQKVGQIMEKGTVLSRAKDNISNEVGRLANYVTNPSSMVTDLTNQFQQLLGKRGTADEVLSGVSASADAEEEEYTSTSHEKEGKKENKEKNDRKQTSSNYVINAENISPESMATIQAILASQGANNSTRSSIFTVSENLNELVGITNANASAVSAIPFYDSAIGALGGNAISLGTAAYTLRNATARVAPLALGAVTWELATKVYEHEVFLSKFMTEAVAERSLGFDELPFQASIDISMHLYSGNLGGLTGKSDKELIAEFNTIGQVKDQLKADLRAKANTEGMMSDQEIFRRADLDSLVLGFTTAAEHSTNAILEKYFPLLPDSSKTERVIGTYKHSFMSKSFKAYKALYNEDRIDSEVSWKNHQELDSFTAIFRKGSSRFDFVTPKGLLVWDAKFGVTGSDYNILSKTIKNAAKGVTSKDVKPIREDGSGGLEPTIINGQIVKKGTTKNQ